MNTNDNGFVSVIIQYRLGAFGFLSSREVAENGVVNAGLLDQNFALQWVQKYIDRFGGDPRRVTMAGESAGAGAAMLQAMAYGGRQREKLFENVCGRSNLLLFHSFLLFFLDQPSAWLKGCLGIYYMSLTRCGRRV